MGQVYRDRVSARWVRTALVLILLACFGGLQTVSAVTVHSHNHGNGDHCCAICHAGHLPAAQAPVALNAAPSVVTEWRSWHEEAVVPGDRSPILDFSRAPPA
jgi:hypothetical protein